MTPRERNRGRITAAAYTLVIAAVVASACAEIEVVPVLETAVDRNLAPPPPVTRIEVLDLRNRNPAEVDCHSAIEGYDAPATLYSNAGSMDVLFERQLQADLDAWAPPKSARNGTGQAAMPVPATGTAAPAASTEPVAVRIALREMRLARELSGRFSCLIEADFQAFDHVGEILRDKISIKRVDSLAPPEEEAEEDEYGAALAVCLQELSGRMVHKLRARKRR